MVRGVTPLPQLKMRQLATVLNIHPTGLWRESRTGSCRVRGIPLQSRYEQRCEHRMWCTAVAPDEWVTPPHGSLHQGWL